MIADTTRSTFCPTQRKTSARISGEYSASLPGRIAASTKPAASSAVTISG